jgi:hypothetical protein
VIVSNMRVIVCGCRDWADRRAIEGALGYAATLANGDPLTVVHGGASGADAIAATIAREWGVACEAHPAEWNTLGNAAGPIRNEHMAKLGADLCLAFWDGQSRGTLDMIQRATKHGIPVRIVPNRRPSPVRSE